MIDPNLTTTFDDDALDTGPEAVRSRTAYDPIGGLRDDGIDHPAREQGLRGAVRSDIENGRDWARHRAEQARSHIADRPVEATFYALGVGVLIGLLLRR